MGYELPNVNSGSDVLTVRTANGDGVNETGIPLRDYPHTRSHVARMIETGSLRQLPGTRIHLSDVTRDPFTRTRAALRAAIAKISSAVDL